MTRSDFSPRLLVGLLGLALLAWALYSNIEFYDEEVESGWSLEALRNPYLAAQQFFERSGIPVIDADSLDKLDSLQGVRTLLITDANQVVSPRQVQQVLAWLENDGNIILTANAVSNSDDLLLKEFNVEVARRDYDDDEQGDGKSISESMREYNRQIEEGKTREEIAGSLGEETALTIIGFGEEIGDLEIAFNTARVLKHPYIESDDYDDDGQRPVSWSSSDHGVHMMQFEVGEGLLTIVSDSSIWTSYRIDAYDHAYLLWILSSRDGDFAILRPLLRDSLWQLALQHASEMLIAAALLLALWLWYLGHRFGRILPRSAGHARAMGEHFASITQYLWQRKRAGDLIAPLRQRVLRRASLNLAEFARADEQRQYELIAERCEVPVDSVRRALHSSQFNETTFVHTVKLLRQLEQSL